MSIRKIFNRPEDLAPHIEELKKGGATVVFSNGCFELLHVGHIRYLQAARALGTLLIVAVNSDESMRIIKPERKPVIPDVERYEIVAAIEAVDYVVPLRERTPDSLLLLFKPHIHTKGTDYTIERIPERALVESYGGKVMLVGDPKEHSTTQMLKTLRRGTGEA